MIAPRQRTPSADGPSLRQTHPHIRTLLAVGLYYFLSLYVSIIMKLSAVALLAVYSSVAQAFAPPSSSLNVHQKSSSSSLFAIVDSRAAVRQALDLSKKYGVTSPEARVAWDAVEEMRAADNRYVRNEGYFERANDRLRSHSLAGLAVSVCVYETNEEDSPFC